MASEEMSREEKEALLNIRMEQIRKKNAELQKRYEEVKADKQHAEEMSDTFQEKHRNIVEEPRVRRTAPKPTERPREKPRYNEGRVPQRSAPEEQEKRRPQRFTEEDGPPPDPSYSFLADRSREGNNSAAQDRRRDSRRHQGNFGGKDFDNVKSTMEHRRGYDKSSPRQPPQNKMEMSMRMTGRERCEYERWRSERSKIEHDRMNRQKTSSGEWKREWDKEKNSSNEPEETAPPDRWGPQNRGGGRGDRSRGSRGSRQWSDHPQRQPYPQSPESGDAPLLQENLPRPRHIQLDNDSINVSFSNDRVAPSSRTWRTSDDRRSTSSRELSSSVSEDERPPPGRRGNMRWCDQARSPKSRKPPSADDTVFKNEGSGDCKQPQSPKPEKPIEQRVFFMDSGIQAPLEASSKEPSSQGEAPQISDDLPDDCSWDDEGSWEEATSGNDSQEHSQHSQEVSEAALPANAREALLHIPAAEPVTSPPGGASTVMADADDTAEAPLLESRESTPVVELREALNAEAEEHAALDDPQPVEIPQPSAEFPLHDVESQKTEDFAPQTAICQAEGSQQDAEFPQQSAESSKTEDVTPQTVICQAGECQQDAEFSQQPAESQRDACNPQQSAESQQDANFPQQSAESHRDASNPQQSASLTLPAAESTQQPAESSQPQTESSCQPAECQENRETSQWPTESSQLPAESTQQLDEFSQQHAESLNVAPEIQVSEEKAEALASHHARGSEVQDVPQTEINGDERDAKPPVEEAGETCAANGAATDEGEAQAAPETSSNATPVPSDTEASHEEKTDQ